MNTRVSNEAKPMVNELKPGDRLAVDAKEAAALLGISERHFRDLNSAGRVPEPIKLGKSPRWSVDELRAWLAAGGPARERWDAVKKSPSR